jgi:tetratricopeptide (TPR) repeat protein
MTNALFMTATNALGQAISNATGQLRETIHSASNTFQTTAREVSQSARRTLAAAGSVAAQASLATNALAQLLRHATNQLWSAASGASNAVSGAARDAHDSIQTALSVAAQASAQISAATNALARMLSQTTSQMGRTAQEASNAVAAVASGGAQLLMAALNHATNALWSAVTIAESTITTNAAMQRPTPFSIVFSPQGPALAVSLEATNASQVFQAYLEGQGRQRATQPAAEQDRLETAVASASNTAAVMERLRLLEKSWESDRQRDSRTLHDPGQTQLLVIVALAFLVVMVVVLVAWMQWQAVHKLAETHAAGRSSPDAGCEPAGRSAGDSRPLAGLAASTPQFSEAWREGLSQLLQRVEKIEHAVAPKYEFEPRGHAHARVSGSASEVPPSSPPPVNAIHLRMDRDDVLVQKGQTLLNLGRDQEALACFEEALADRPDDAELLVKKGMTEERLQRLEAALASYDQALQRDGAFAAAYLLKGGVLSRLRRDAEALACYEMALRIQSPSRPPPPAAQAPAKAQQPAPA